MMAELSGGGRRKSSRISYQASSKLDRQRNLTLKTRPKGYVEPLGRSSLRSKGSSNSSEDKARIFKNCIRKMVEFLFTQVGVGAVVVCYTIVGASIFQAVETEVEDPTLIEMEATRNSTIQRLWDLTDTYNTLNKRAWKQNVDQALGVHQDKVVHFAHKGYDGRSNAERWTFPSALMFTLSTITMIGYGNLVPKTKWGKIGVMIYACFGIPVYILYFMNMGKVFAGVLKWLYTKAYRWNVKRKWRQAVNFPGLGSEDELDEAYMDELEQQVIVPSTTCLWVIAIYLLIGTVMFAEWEGWNYLDSVYFCVISLGKIGFGDLVPGTSTATNQDSSTHEVKLVVNFVYLLLGMAIVAMCYYLLKEEVTVKLQFLKDKLNAKMASMKLVFCTRRSK